MINAKSIIAKKRDGGTLTESEIRFLVEGAVDGSIDWYHLTAFMMAVYFQGMSTDETALLTRAMIDSGERLPVVEGKYIPVDKHSTGGVGDKVSFLIAPLAAAAGATVPMISGRSLGHTGGTLDKLESIPGYRTALGPDEFVACVRDVGTCIAGQSDTLVPADRLFYSLRDAASIVESVPLITASILSKKVAEGIGALVLDVKVGGGAFMAETEDGLELARSLVHTADSLGVRARAYLTRMDRVLGRTAGNALEIAESAHALRQGPEATEQDLAEVTRTLGGGMLELAGIASSQEEGEREIDRVWKDRSGYEKFLEMIQRQGGDTSVIEDTDLLPAARTVLEVPSPEAGCFAGLEARPVGEWITEMGGGRLVAGASIDPTVGVEIVVAMGGAVEVGDTVAKLHLPTRPPSSFDEERTIQTASAWITLGNRETSRLVEIIDSTS